MPVEYDVEEIRSGDRAEFQGLVRDALALGLEVRIFTNGNRESVAHVLHPKGSKAKAKKPEPEPEAPAASEGSLI